MRLYGDGVLVYQSQSDDGVIEVVDLKGIRSLHFGTVFRQSSLSLTCPHTLVLPYTATMMACLLFCPQPSRVLMVGLGGGAIVRFLLHHFPHCHLDVIECRQDVVRVAHAYFQVPDDDARLHIHIGDGYSFVRQCYDEGVAHYDLVIVDAYDHKSMAASVGTLAFFDACRAILTARGVMSINLWQGIAKQTMIYIDESFNQQAMTLPVAHHGNVIGLATASPVSHTSLKKLKQAAYQQDTTLDIGLTRSWRYLTRQKKPFIGRFFG